MFVILGLKRTGKSCRLRWLNYLRPDVRRGNITPEEQLLIIELHAKWGNRQVHIYIYIYMIMCRALFKIKHSIYCKTKNKLKQNAKINDAKKEKAEEEN